MQITTILLLRHSGNVWYRIVDDGKNQSHYKKKTVLRQPMIMLQITIICVAHRATKTKNRRIMSTEIEHSKHVYTAVYSGWYTHSTSASMDNDIVWHLPLFIIRNVCTEILGIGLKLCRIILTWRRNSRDHDYQLVSSNEMANKLSTLESSRCNISGLQYTQNEDIDIDLNASSQIVWNVTSFPKN